MALRLSPEDEAEYQRRLMMLEAVKHVGVATGDVRGAKRARQSITTLYLEFSAKQLPPEPPTPWERELCMTLEERIDRIERYLGLGKYNEE